MKHIPITIWNAHDDDITITHRSIPCATEKEANVLAKRVESAILKQTPYPHIQVTFNAKCKDMVTDKDVTIRLLSPEKQAAMGKPLDMQNEDERQKAIEALMNQDPAYTIDDSDMIACDITVKDLINTFGDGYSLGSLAYATEQIN